VLNFISENRNRIEFYTIFISTYFNVIEEMWFGVTVVQRIFAEFMQNKNRLFGFTPKDGFTIL